MRPSCIYRLAALLLFVLYSLSLSAENDICDFFQASIEAPDGLRHCPDDESPVSFIGSATYTGGETQYDPANFSYSWLIDEQSYSGSEVSYVFDGPGAYTIRLVVTDNETGCTATAVEVVMIGTLPVMEGTMASVDTACSGEVFTLYGLAEPVVWTGFPTEIREDPPVLIGAGDNQYYESGLEFDVFSEGVEILSAGDFDVVCVHIEHVDQSQLSFELESPNGTVIELKSSGGPGVNLGEPVVWEDDIPGQPYSYCFSPQPQFGTMAETTPLYHEYSDNAGNYYFNAAYLPGGNYTPVESLDGFAGSTLNGRWTLRAEDHTLGESGHIFGWTLLFSEEFYPDSLIFSPEIVEETWYRNGSALDGNPAAVSVSDQGDHTFVFEVVDNFGCTYTTSVEVSILPLPEAEIISELEIPICEGDSTLLTVQPLNSDGFGWEYQWQFGGVDMPERTYDTLMVKDPGVYTVVVTDTGTGCSDFFDIDVSEQNCDLTIPNVFTPNADGINDLFEIENLEHYPNAQMVIYNRWGQKVFEHTDYYNNWWDGANAPDGTYFYVLRYTRMGKTRYTEGTVTIIR